MISLSFRPLAGLSCINQSFQIQSMLKILTREFPSPRGVELHKPSNNCRVCIEFCVCFRPLAGLSCINLGLELAAHAAHGARFRPLAGLSCINRDTVIHVKTDSIKFPSPRGVELHKPLWLLVRRSSWDFRSFPSPRGVELHKPKQIRSLAEEYVARFRPLAGLSCINLALRLPTFGAL